MAVKKELHETFEVDVAPGESLKSTLASSQNPYLINTCPQGSIRHVVITLDMVEEENV